ncbi:MAG: nuclear transport factor 2 family protein, partial [Phenylobacterium sp.]|nr:nuclear transport factor 2 family protein [Phenylobacterium sp.]
VELSPDGRSARVLSHVTSRIERGGAVRLSCAQRVQAVTLAGGRLLSRGQTDTAVRCRR